MRYRKFQQVKKVRWPVGNLTITDFNRPRQEKKPVVIKKKRNPTGNGNKKKRNKISSSRFERIVIKGRTSTKGNQKNCR